MPAPTIFISYRRDDAAEFVLDLGLTQRDLAEMVGGSRQRMVELRRKEIHRRARGEVARSAGAQHPGARDAVTRPHTEYLDLVMAVDLYGTDETRDALAKVRDRLPKADPEQGADACLLLLQLLTVETAGNDRPDDVAALVGALGSLSRHAGIDPDPILSLARPRRPPGGPRGRGVRRLGRRLVGRESR